MSKIYRKSRNISRLLYKIRHHRGHGIHSPFVFDLITKVIEEKSVYYAYQDINNHIESFPSLNLTTNKTHRLLFRLVNWFSSKKILELGSGKGVSTLFLTAPSTEISCVIVETSQEKYILAAQIYNKWSRNIIQSNTEFPNLKEKQDCIYINLNSYKVDYLILVSYIQSLVKDDSFIIIDGIRTNKDHQMLWKTVVSLDEVVISLDLYYLGILFFNKKYYKRNYKLSF